jgi:signal transduction histidine kinase
MNQIKQVFPSITLETIYEIDKILWQSKSWRTVMDEFVKFVRPYFIFDNVVLYLVDPMTMNLEVAFARATGRGKSAEADVAWGEIIGNKLVETKQKMLQEPNAAPEIDRLKQPHTLGFPLLVDNQVLGAIIFIRFGGPVFTDTNIVFAEYLSRQISFVIARENLKKENERLEFQYRVFQVQEDFIATLSHELRSPLGFIKGYTTTLLREDANWDDKTQHEFLAIIDQETDRLQDLIANLLDSAKLQSGQVIMNFQTVRLDALMKDVMIRARAHHPEMDIKTQIPSPIKSIRADPRRLAQILENLIGNAAKYAQGSPVEIDIYEVDKGIQIDFSDQGPGIPEKYQAKIFDRFFRIPDYKPAAHGSGLGLFICKQIVQAHSGQIKITSNPGEGTTFHVFLPETP